MYATRSKATGVTIDFWELGTMPTGLGAGRPVPEEWAVPMAVYPAWRCDSYELFHRRSEIFDTTFWCVSSSTCSFFSSLWLMRACVFWAVLIREQRATTTGIPGQQT